MFALLNTNEISVHSVISCITSRQIKNVTGFLNAVVIRVVNVYRILNVKPTLCQECLSYF